MTYSHPYSRPQSHPFDKVEVLLPLRIHRARRRFAGKLRADLSALIEALATTASLPASDALDEVDPEQFKTWALALIRALPTRSAGEASWE